MFEKLRPLPNRRAFVTEILKNYRLSPDRKEARAQLEALNTAVKNGEVTKNDVAKFLRNAQVGASAFLPKKEWSFMQRMVNEFGWKNFANMNISSRLVLHLFDSWGDFDPGVYRDHLSLRGDFTGADFTNADVTGVRLAQTDLRDVTMPHVRIRGESIDLTKDAIKIKSPSPFKQIDVHAQCTVDNCPDCERINKMVLGLDSKNQDKQSRGVMLFWENNPIGYMKLKGSSSFLALRTVRDTNGDVIFYRGMVYALGPISGVKLYTRLSAVLRNAPIPHNENTWGKIDIEDILKTFGRDSIEINHLRFISDPAIYKRLSELIASISADTELFTEITL